MLTLISDIFVGYLSKLDSIARQLILALKNDETEFLVHHLQAFCSYVNCSIINLFRNLTSAVALSRVAPFEQSYIILHLLLERAKLNGILNHVT